MQPQPAYVNHEMICVCHAVDVERASHAKLAALIELDLCRSDQLALGIILSLALEYGVTVSVVVDMWFGVAGTFPDGSVHCVECDDPLDGMVLLWNVARVGMISSTSYEDVPVGMLHSSAHCAIAKQLASYNQELLAAECARNTHKVECSACAQRKPCATKAELISSYLIIRNRIFDMWGSPDVSVSPSFYGMNAEDVADET